MQGLDLTGRCLLVVDDVDFSRKILVNMLERMGQPKILTAADGLQALQTLTHHREVDAVISDFNMPGLNGLGLLKAIRTGTNKIKPDLPFAMITGHSDKSLVDIALSLDVNAFVLKPVSSKVMASRLNMMFSANPGASAEDADKYEIVDVQSTAAAAKETPIQLSVESLIEGEDKNVSKEWRVEKTAELASGISFLKGLYESDLGRKVIANIDRLLVENGLASAQAVIGALNAMVENGSINSSDFNAMVTPPKDSKPVPKPKPDPGLSGTEAFARLESVPTGSRLQTDLASADGSLFMTAGTFLTDQIISMLVHLSSLNLLALEEVDGVLGLRVMIEGPVRGPDVGAGSAAGAGQRQIGRQVAIASIRTGDRLTRDVFSDSGTLLLSDGTRLTERFVPLLQDLAKLNVVEDTIWVEDR